MKGSVDESIAHTRKLELNRAKVLQKSIYHDYPFIQGTEFHLLSKYVIFSNY